MSDPILKGVRVLDFGRYIAAPFCAALLADLGADVIRIEPALGSDDRFIMPVGDETAGALYLQMNRNKRSLALDLTRPEYNHVLHKLVKSSDIVVANLPPRALKKAGLDYESLRAIKNDIILTSVTAFGSKGEFKDNVGFDASGQALSGSILINGTPENPYRASVSYVDYATALSAAFGSISALLAHRMSGEGRHIEVSLLGTALNIMNPMLIEESSGARSRTALGNRSPISGPSDLFKTLDGWIFVQVIGQDMFERWIDAVGANDLRGDERFASDLARGENGAVLSVRMQKWCDGKSTDECLSLLKSSRVPACRVLSPAAAVSAPENIPFFNWTEASAVGAAVPIVRTIAQFSQGALDPDSFTPAPALGQDTRSILSGLGFEPTEIELLLDGAVSAGSVMGRETRAKG
jgi:crotonobetainyl-CoA:carnitine CoA-transferase CaiB-like acyl-CoA transferase